MAAASGRASPTAFSSKFDEGGSTGLISKADERAIAEREQPYQRTFWDRALNRRIAPEGYPNTGADTASQAAWARAADQYAANPPPPPPGWKRLDDQTRTEAYDPTKDYRDPRNTGYVDRSGRVNPMYDPSRDQTRGPAIRPPSPAKPATKISSSQAITDKINKIVGPPQEPPPVLPQDFVPGINLRPQFSSEYDVPPDARPPGSPPVVTAGQPDPTLYPQVWGLPSFNQSDYPPAGPAVTAGHPALPTLQRYLDWRNRKLDELTKWGEGLGSRIGNWNGKLYAGGGPVGFARGGRSGASAYEQASDLGDDDYMPSVSLGMLRGPSTAVLAPFLPPPALPGSTAAASGSGGAGDMIGGLGKILGGVMGGGKGVTPTGPQGTGPGGTYTTGDLNTSGGLGGLPGGGLFGGGGGGFPDIDAEILDWSGYARGGRAGFAQGGDMGDDDFMPSVSLGQMHAPSTPALAPLLPPPAPAPPPGGGGGGGGGGGDIFGSIMKMAPMALAFLNRGGPLPMMRGGYPQLLQAPPVRRTAFSTGGGDHYVRPDGRGNGRSDHIDAALSPGEFVMDAETTSMLGDGDNEAGARKLEGLRQNVRKHKGRALARGKFSPKAKAPEQYMSAGLSASDRLAHSGMGDGMRQLGRR